MNTLAFVSGETTSSLIADMVNRAATVVPGCASPGRGAARSTETPSLPRAAGAATSSNIVALTRTARSRPTRASFGVRIGVPPAIDPVPYLHRRIDRGSRCLRAGLVVDQPGRAEPDGERQEHGFTVPEAIELGQRPAVRDADIGRGRERLARQRLPHRAPKRISGAFAALPAF